MHFGAFRYHQIHGSAKPRLLASLANRIALAYAEQGQVRGTSMQRFRSWLVGTALCAAIGCALTGVAAAQSSSGPPHVDISPRHSGVINLPVIPQGNYLDPGPGAPIKPDVGIGGGRNEDYVFPPNLDGFMGSSPPGDPTDNGQWSPLPGDTPSF